MSRRSPQGAAECSSQRGGESTDTGTDGTVPFYGDHQAGILTPQQHHLQFASYDVTASNVAEVRDLLGSWTGLAARLTRGDDPGSGGGEFAPPDDTGEAGGLDPARLTLTVGFGPGLFDDRFGLAGKRPPELADLPRFEKDELDPRNPAATSASRPARTTLRWRSTRSAT